MDQDKMLIAELRLAAAQAEQGTLTREEVLHRLQVILDEYGEDKSYRE